ncbi:MAG: hypothetical protein RBS09_02305 [Anaerolineaceae bacterium]|jgi:hypothetical protein|nr:hypothetical protein [Anaerolineaceae bacterium]
MKKTHYLIGIFLVLALALVFSEAQAQEQSQWILKLTRNFGYGSGSDIQGNMTLSLGGDLNSITKVVYYIDDELMAEVSQNPFKLPFNTDDYQPGVHEMRAEITSNDGKVMPAGPIVYNFLSAIDAGGKTTTMIVVILGITAAAMGLSWLISSRQKDSGVMTAGIHGLAVCNRCGKTFPRSFFGMNMVIGKFERCPHCGKWQITRRASPLEIEWANERNQPEEPERIVEKPEEDDLDESRFIDL